MRERERSGRGGAVLRGVIIAVFIFTLAVTITLFFRPLYYLDITLLNLPEASGLTAEQVRKNYDVMIDYNAFWNKQMLVFPDLPMSQQGRIHFREVKAIFSWIQYICIGSGVITILWSLARRRRAGYAHLVTAGILCITVPAVLCYAAFFHWEQLFVGFHEMFFSNDYWIFDPRKDPVILILPDSFFFQCAVMILAITFTCGIICFVCAGKRKRKFRESFRRRRR